MCVSDYPEDHVTSCVCSKPTIITLGFLAEEKQTLGKKQKQLNDFFSLLLSILLHIISSCCFQSSENIWNLEVSTVQVSKKIRTD